MIAVGPPLARPSFCLTTWARSSRNDPELTPAACALLVGAMHTTESVQRQRGPPGHPARPVRGGKGHASFNFYLDTLTQQICQLRPAQRRL
jgi:hypothetical protein